MIDTEKINLFIIKTNIILAPTTLTVESIAIVFVTITSLFLFKSVFNNFLFKKLLNYLDSLLDDSLQEDTLKYVSKLKKPFNVFIDIYITNYILKSFFPFFEYTNYLFSTLYLLLAFWISFIFVDIFFAGYLYHKEEKIRRSEIVTFSKKIIKFFSIITISLAFLHINGIDITALIASLGIIGMAVALAAKDTLANLFGSLNILLDNPFSQKDWIKTKNVEGTVVEIGLRSTTIRSLDNSLITVPNSELASSYIQNWDRRSIGRQIKLNFGIAYTSDKKALKKALKEIKKMIIKHPSIAFNEDKKSGGLILFEDKVGIKDLLLVNLLEPTPASLNIGITAFSKTTDWSEWLDTQEDIIFKTWEILEKNGIEFVATAQPVTKAEDKIEEVLTPAVVTMPKEQPPVI